MDALAIRNLTVRYGGFLAVDSVSLTVPDRAIHGLIGPNGAGKTSLFNGVCGQVRPRSGAVRVHGHPVRQGSPHAAWQAGISRTFQKAELFWTLNVREHVALARRRALRQRRQPMATDDLLSLLGIADIADETVAALPLGTMRLVELGRALASGSSLVLMDEPCSGLDRAETAEFERVLRSVQRSLSLTLLIVEHDMEFVLSIAERIVVLDGGHLIAEGTPAEILRDPAVHEAYLGVTDGQRSTRQEPASEEAAQP